MLSVVKQLFQFIKTDPGWFLLIIAVIIGIRAEIARRFLRINEKNKKYSPINFLQDEIGFHKYLAITWFLFALSNTFSNKWGVSTIIIGWIILGFLSACSISYILDKKKELNYVKLKISENSELKEG
jgi:uncharacterized membrane protein (DUF106 family)